MKFISEENSILAKNSNVLIENVKNKRVYLYAMNSDDLLIEKFFNICSVNTSIVIKTLNDRIICGNYIVPAPNLICFLNRLKECNICNEEEYKRLCSIRYSENNWTMCTGNIIIYVMERKLKYYIWTKLCKKKPEEMSIAFHIIDHCNLNCQMCNKYSPIAEKNIIDHRKIAQDAERLAELTKGKLKRVILTGGEPLLHPELKQIIEIVHYFFPSIDIQLQTNGLLLKNKDKAFFEFCKKNRTLLWITKYPINYDYDNLFEKIKKEGCCMELAVVENEKTSWHFPLDIQGNQDKMWMFFCWMHGECINCIEGKIYPCGLMHASRLFEKKFECHFERKDSDFIDIYKVQNFQEISSFIASYQSFCRYCNVKEWEINIPWKTSEKNISEWS